MSLVQRALKRIRPSAARRRAAVGADGVPGPERNRYLDPATETREVSDDTHPLHEGVAIQIVYQPERDGDPDPGEVVWTWIPYEEDPTKGKDRPAVIIGRLGDDLVGVPLTSKRRRDEPQVKIGSGEWDRRRRTSYARIDRVMAIDPEAIRREGAVLDRNRFNNVVHGVEERYAIVPTGRGSHDELD